MIFTCQTWIIARSKYNWTVYLTRFQWAKNYPGHFNRIITPANTITFEDKFREAIERSGSFETAGEVCFWKNYKSQKKDELTIKLLRHLQSPNEWNKFIQTIKELPLNPSFKNFEALQKACNQPKGFATPLTFLAFYRPTEYPMVDKHIAFWWRDKKAEYGYRDSPVFSQRNNGWIKPDPKSWQAYLSWVRFCCEYARLVSDNCEVKWRARDIEMAVWEAQKRGLQLNVLPLLG